jgi:hypothetical protein
MPSGSAASWQTPASGLSVVALLRAPFSTLLSCDAKLKRNASVCAGDAPRTAKVHGTPGMGLYSIKDAELPTSTDPTARALAYLGGVLRTEKMLMAVQPVKLRNAILSDAICLDLPQESKMKERVCISPRDIRTGRRFPLPDAARSGVLVNEPADSISSGYVALADNGAVKSQGGPFQPNATLGDATAAKDVVYSFRSEPKRRRGRTLTNFAPRAITGPGGGFTQFALKALRSVRKVYYPIMQSLPLKIGEEITACYDNPNQAGDGGEYLRTGYQRPLACGGFASGKKS